MPMRKFTYLFLGLVMIVGAGAFAFQRYAPSFNSRVAQSENRSAPDVATRSLRRAPARERERERDGLASFDRAIDLMNLVIGALGIWFSIKGLRMQRQAVKVMAMRNDEGKGGSEGRH